MTEPVLSIDCTIEPARAVVLAGEGDKISIVELHSRELGNIFSRDALIASQTPTETTQNSGDSSDGNVNNAVPNQATLSPLQELIASVKSPWTSAVVLMPTYEYLSLNLSLPFSESSKINKILPLEVQDIVPFDIADFLLQPQVVSSNGGPNHEVHVSLIPRDYIAGVLQTCKQAQLEPFLLTTVSSALGSLYQVAGESLAKNAALIFERGHFLYVVFALDGSIRADHIIDKRMLSLNPNIDHINHEVATLIKAFERRTERSIEQLYVVSEADEQLTSTELLHKVTNIPVSIVSLHDLVGPKFAGQDQHSAAIAALGGFLAVDDNPKPALTNFRTGEFAFNLQLSELFSGLKRLLPYILGLVVTFALTLTVIFAMRETKTDRLDSAIRAQIKHAIPDLKVDPGKELLSLQKETGDLSQQLKDLGIPSQSSLLDALRILAETLPSQPNVTIKRVSIKGNRIDIEGNGPDSGSAEPIEKALKKKREIFCRVNLSINSSSMIAGTAGKGFSLEVWMCE